MTIADIPVLGEKVGRQNFGVTAGSLCLLFLVFGCTRSTPPTAEPVTVKAEPKGELPLKSPASSPAPRVRPIDMPLKPTEDPCRVPSKLNGPPPLVSKPGSLVLTRFLQPCTASDGKSGLEKGSSYLAMGFPCTGGNGRVELKGHYNNPKMVTFVLSTDCPMAPQTKEQAQSILSESLGLPKDVKLAAHTPFVVQFWEIPGMSDADTGYQVELRSAPAVEGLWRRFLKNEPVKVRLYGRENTWAQSGNVFFVEGEIRMTGRTAFSLQVAQVKLMTSTDLSEVKARCEALLPKRNCGEVF